jgi:hypothetical protein
MTRRPLAESVSISSIISDTKELLRQLEEVESVITHHQRAPSGAKRRATAKQPIDKTRFIAIFKEISQKAQAYITRFEEQETRDDETHETRDDETHETRDDETHESHVEETHKTPDDETPDEIPNETPDETPDEIPNETPDETPDETHVEETDKQRDSAGHRGLSECSTRALDLLFPCQLSQLGINMVGTIQEARDKLVLQDVNERGYLILEVQGTWDPLELTTLLRTAKAPGRDEIKGFKLAQGTSGCLHARVARNIPLSLQDLEGFNEARGSLQPKMEFEEWISGPPNCVEYLICEPLSDHSINRLLDAGSQCNRRPEIPGVNRPYWYVSGESNTPATLHREDGNTGSANLLLAGAEKHWIIVPRSSADKLESCIREQYPASKSCSQFLRHHNVIVGPRWLETRGIHYEIVRQKPGDLLVTLPGRVYHEVRNTGRNFAIAINYEFLDAPDEPVDYVWCENGERKCGQGVLTHASFMPTTSDRAFDTEDETPEPVKKRMHAGVEAANKRLRTSAPLLRRRNTRRILRPSCVPTPVSALAPVQHSLPHVILSAILSKASLCNCARLVTMWRLQSTRIELAPESEDKISRLAALDKRVCLAQSRN